MKRDEGASLANASSPARFIVGSIHDDCLLVCEHLTIETFSSPYVLSLATKTGARGQLPRQKFEDSKQSCHPRLTAQSPVRFACTLSEFSVSRLLGMVHFAIL